jgi:two-component system response regulator WspF
VHAIARGDAPRPGTVAVAGGSDDLVITPQRTFAYRRPPHGSFYHPSVDRFFISLGEHWPDPGLAVVLTGMGRDGAQGLLRLRRLGWQTIAQDQSSSAVYGMPRVAAEIGAADRILPIDAIGPAIGRFAAGSAPGMEDIA